MFCRLLHKNGILPRQLICMKPRNVVYSLLFILILFGVAIIKRWQEPRRGELFNRSTERVVYTKFALCRMNCQYIIKNDVEDIMKAGIINLNKSDRRYKPCPTYALQGRTKRGSYLRIVFAQCDVITNIISCVDVEKSFTCNCGGRKN